MTLKCCNMHQFGLSQLKGSTENNSKVVDAEPQSVDTEIVSLEGFTPEIVRSKSRCPVLIASDLSG